MRRVFLRISVIHLIMIAMLFVTACGDSATTRLQNNDDEHIGNHGSQDQLQRRMSTHSAQLDGARSQALSLRTHDGAQYILLSELVGVLEYQSEWDRDSGTYQIGDTDVIYTINLNSAQARIDEETIQLQHTPLAIDGDIYLDKQTFQQLFRDDLNYAFTDDQLIIYATESDELLGDDDPDLDFADDPNDDTVIDESVWHELVDQLDAEALEVLKKVNRSSIIATARRYLGVKYKFGAKPYAQSRRFDCSSFTQHVYKAHGVSLRRTARSQATQGVAVSRKNLRVGDLLFFNVPGRFKSNKVVGHVGIYMGNNRMIHAGVAPKNGVQIANINSSYWKKTFLRARRVVA